MLTHSHCGRQNQHHAFTFRKGIQPQSCYSCQHALAAQSNRKKQNLLLGARKWKLRNSTSMQFQQEPDAELPLQSLENPFLAMKLDWESQIFSYCYYCLRFSVLLVTSHIHRSKFIKVYSCKYRQTSTVVLQSLNSHNKQTSLHSTLKHELWLFQSKIHGIKK